MIMQREKILKAYKILKQPKTQIHNMTHKPAKHSRKARDGKPKL